MYAPLCIKAWSQMDIYRSELVLNNVSGNVLLSIEEVIQIKWSGYQNMNIFSQEYAFKIVVYKM